MFTDHYFYLLLEEYLLIISIKGNNACETTIYIVMKFTIFLYVKLQYKIFPEEKMLHVLLGSSMMLINFFIDFS